MKRILYIHANSNIIGGVETFIESALFHHRKFEPYIIFINDGKLPERIRKKGFKNVYILNGCRPCHIHTIPVLIYKITKFIKDKKIDFVIGRGFYSLAYSWFYSWFVSKFVKIKRVYYYGRFLCDNKKPAFPIPIWLASYTMPDIILANSFITQESIKAIFKNPTEIEVIYPGVDISLFDKKTDSSQLRQELNIPTESKVVSMISRIAEWRGHKYFIRAAKEVLRQMSEVYFLVVGEPSLDEDRIYYNKLINLTKEFNIKERVIFTGFREDIPEILNMSSIVVAPSIEPEPFGRSVVEAMASGKPVIATAIGGPLEIIDSGINGILIPPKDEFALKEAIIKLLSDEGLRNNIGRNARLKVRAKFSIEDCISKIENTLEKIN